MEQKRLVEKGAKTKTDDLIVIGGGGGFIGGALARYFAKKGFTRIRAVDKKPLPEWYQRVPGTECLTMDLSEEANCKRACEGATEVYNLAADMGGMGFIERFRVECLRPVEVLSASGSKRTEIPFYELYGEKLVAAGHYETAIRYADHFLPLAEAVWRHVETH